MGLFSFVTEAGGKLGSKVYDMLNDDEDITKPVTISPERVNELRKVGVEQILEETLGEDATAITVDVDASHVVLAGSAPTQAVSEKATLCAGNTNGIASVDCQIAIDQTAEAESEPEAQFYTVKSGDTLSKIAKEFYDSANKYHAIFEANKPMLSDPNKIYVGQTLRIPAL